MSTGSGPAAPGRRLVHEALVYGSDDDLVSVVAPFLRDGVEAGEPALIGVGRAQQRLVLDALGGDGGDSGVVVLDPDQYTRPYETIRRNDRLYRRLVDGGARRVRVVGTVPAALATWHGWARYEAAMNHVVGDLPVWAICLYDERSTPDTVLDDVARTHTHFATPDGRHEPNRRYVAPSRFLAERAGADVDPLEATPPDVELRDPSLAGARQALVRLVAAAALGQRAVDGLRLAVTEVLANATEHGRPPVTVRAWGAPDRVVVAVADTGPGTPDACVGLVPLAASDLHGLGLHLAYQVCSELTLEHRDDGFTVHLVARDA